MTKERVDDMAGHRTQAGVVAALLTLLGVVSVQPTSTLSAAHAAGELATLPSSNPANFTPNVLDGEVDSIWQVDNRIIVGGTFTQVANAVDNGGQVYSRTYLAAFDATTGIVDTNFNPALSGFVTTVLSSGDGTSIYIGGDFNTVNGVNRRKVARIDLADGSLVTGFNALGVNGMVKDLRLANGQLYMTGIFTSINSQTRTGLASLNPTTGALTTSLNVTLAGRKNGGTTNAYKFDITPAGDRMLVIGNFLTVNGLNRSQIVMLDLSTNPATVAPWQTDWYTAICSSSFESYMRDLDISDDGSFAVISTTGAFKSGQACDSVSRFEVYNNNAAIAPTWVAYTGGDTTYAIQISKGVVYAGGHFRWTNNPTAADTAGAGAVPRTGIAALDPVNGMAFSFNPGRERGVGLFDFFVTDAGLWAGSDTDRWADELRQRLAFFPFKTGSLVPTNNIGNLPSDIYLVGRTAGSLGAADSAVLYRINAGGPALPSADDGPGWAADTSSTSTLRTSGSSSSSYIGVGLIDSTVPASDFDRTPVSLFSTERYDPAGGNEMQWNLDVPVGTPIQVRLFMSARCSCTNDPGERVFNVDLDGANVLANLDVNVTPGFNTGTMRSFNIVSDGQVNILFRHGVENPDVNGIEIVRTDQSGVGALGTQDDLQRRFYNGGATAAANNVIAGTLPWHNARGSFMVNNILYTGNVDGSLVKRTFDGATFGPAQLVQMYGNTMTADMPNVTGMFLEPVQERLYYTLTGDSNLYSRAFTPESSTIGSARTTAGGAVASLSPSRVRGMFLSGGYIWFADAASGALLKIPFTTGVVSGTAVVAESTQDWRALDMFVSTAAPAPGPNTAPTAATFSSSCTYTNCTFTDGGSTDLDGYIASYGWTFGDGTTGTGSPASHFFPGTGDYTVTLTVTDDDGATAQKQAVIHVDAAPNVPPTASFTQTCSARLCSFDGSGSTDSDGVLTSYAWNFGDGATATGPTTTHTYGADGTFPATLTVTDNALATNAVSHDVLVQARAIAFRASSAANSTGAAASVVVPATVQVGDQLVLFVTANLETTLTTPTGWILLGTQADGTPDMRSWVFTRTAVAGTAGSTVTGTFGLTTAKSSRLLMAYSGAAVPAVLASAATVPSTNQHTTPVVNVAVSGSYVASYWSDKSGGNAGWTLPGTITTRQSSLGSGSGQITAAAGDAGPITAGTRSGVTATSSATSAKAIEWSVVIPSGDPTAAFTPNCVGLGCSFDASASVDGNGSIVSYGWKFGDGTTGTGVTPSHTYTAGTYDVILTVTDNDGATGTATIQVVVAPLPNQAPTASSTKQCIGLDCTFDASASTDNDGTIQSYSWDFGDGSTATGVTAAHSFAAATTYHVVLTVTDDDAAPGTSAQDITPSSTLVAFRAASATNSTGAAASVVVPATVQTGDQLVLFVTANADTTVTMPASWTLLGTQVDGTPDMRSWVFTATAGATTAGTTVTGTLGAATAKSSRILLAYSGAGVPTVAASVFAGASTANHLPPSVSVATAGSFVASYWSDKTAGNAGWTLPGNVAARQSSLGSGSGQITAAAGDTGPLVAGTWNGATATSSIASAKAIHWSVVIPTA